MIILSLCVLVLVMEYHQNMQQYTSCVHVLVHVLVHVHVHVLVHVQVHVQVYKPLVILIHC